MTYRDFLESKVVSAPKTGISVSPAEISPALKPHQRDAVLWALSGGRRALFESFGLGKGCQQLEWCRILSEKTGGKALIICPLGVKQEFARDAVELLHIEPPQYVRTMEEVRNCNAPIMITNYERVRDGDIYPKYFTAVTLDEASVLRSFGSKTYQTFLRGFKGIPYKLVATATPSPNRYKELIHYAGYLEIMDTAMALTRFFQRDSTKANNLTIYPHKQKEFWLWLSTWALFLQKPSDLGYSDEGYDLPPLEVRYHKLQPSDVSLTYEKDGQGKMIPDFAVGLSQASKEKRESIDLRVAEMKRIVDESPDDSFILWHDLEAERHAIKKALPECKEIYGSQDLETRERNTIDFSEGKYRLLATKKELSGSGCNFQRHCHREIFVGIDYEFNDFIQAIHRCYRFMQDKPVVVDIIYMETEQEILKVLKEKWKQYDEMTEKMEQIIKKYGLAQADAVEEMKRSIGVERIEVTGERYRAIHNDCVEELKNMPENSVDEIITSIPFCYDEKTEVLTKRGWLNFKDVSLENEIATFNATSKKMEYQRPSHVLYEPYKGEMIEFSGRAFNLLVTPNHRMYAAKRQCSNERLKFGIVTADEITKYYENAKRFSTKGERLLRGYKLSVLPESFDEGNYPEKIYIPEIPQSIKRGHGVSIPFIKTKDFMKLIGWYVTEGHIDGVEKRTFGRISIGQSKTVNPDYYGEIKELFERIGLPPTTSENQLSVWCRNLAYFMLTNFGDGAKHKYIPRWILDLHPALLKIIRDTMMKGDGSRDGTSYATTSIKLKDAFQEICLKTGWRAIISGEKLVNVGTKQVYPEIRHIPKRKQYDGMIGCVTVPNGLIIVRRNGFPCISGNSNHYEYTESYNDFGHNENTERFFEQMDYMTPNLLKVLKPGRVYCCHVKDRILFGNTTGTGMPTVEPFHALTIMHYIKHGFQFMGMITVVTDVVRENNQTYRLGWTEQCKDGTKMGVGCEEYILLFRKLPTDTSNAYADEPVVKSKDDYSRGRWQIDAHGYWRTSGDRLMSKDELLNIPVKNLQKAYRKYSRETVYSYDEHVKLANELDKCGKLPASFMVVAPGSWNDSVWDDINRMKTLNTNQRQKRKQLHLCPLQIEIVERLVDRYSNEGDTILDPFGGLMTVPLVAMQKGRKGIGIELNPDYFRDGVGYLQTEEEKQCAPTLFDFVG